MKRGLTWTLAALLIGLFGNAVHAQIPPEAPDVEVISERMLLTRGPEGPLVLHMVQLVNVGPRVAEQVRLPVPEGAVLLDVPEGLLGNVGFVVDPNPMPAGDGRQYIFSYELPWQRLPMVIRRPLFYPTGMLEVWVEQSLLLRGVGLRAAGEEEIGGRRFTVYVSTDLAPHPQWQALLETETAPGASVSDRERLGQRSDPIEILRANPLPGILLLAALVLIVGAIVVRRKHTQDGLAGWSAADPVSSPDGGPVMGTEPVTGPVGDVEETAPVAPPLRREGGGGKGAEIARLKELIVQIDVAFQNEELEEPLYLERRNALRNELLRLMGRRAPSQDQAEGKTGDGTGEGSS